LDWQNVVKLEEGYRFGGAAFDDADYPTRLGQPTRTLVLVRTADGDIPRHARQPRDLTDRQLLPQMHPSRNVQ
jgi:hypothetical protein